MLRCSKTWIHPTSVISSFSLKFVKMLSLAIFTEKPWQTPGRIWASLQGLAQSLPYCRAQYACDIANKIDQTKHMVCVCVCVCVSDTHLEYLALDVHLSFPIHLLSGVWLFVTPTNCSTPGFPVLHYYPELAPTHVHWVSDTIQLSHSHRPLLLLPSIFPSIRVFSKMFRVYQEMKTKTKTKMALYPKGLCRSTWRFIYEDQW